jgi:hypothetical protein
MKYFVARYNGAYITQYIAAASTFQRTARKHNFELYIAQYSTNRKTEAELALSFVGRRRQSEFLFLNKGRDGLADTEHVMMA